MAGDEKWKGDFQLYILKILLLWSHVNELITKMKEMTGEERKGK